VKGFLTGQALEKCCRSGSSGRSVFQERVAPASAAVLPSRSGSLGHLGTMFRNHPGARYRQHVRGLGGETAVQHQRLPRQ